MKIPFWIEVLWVMFLWIGKTALIFAAVLGGTGLLLFALVNAPEFVTDAIEWICLALGFLLVAGSFVVFVASATHAVNTRRAKRSASSS